MNRICFSTIALLIVGIHCVTGDELGPDQELKSVWAAKAPVLDGVMSDGEWEGAVMVEIDGTDKVRPGVASGDSNTVDQEITKGIYPYESSHAKFYVMNDDRYLYVAVVGYDDILDFATEGGRAYLNDGCEVVVDGNFSRLAKKENDRFGGIAVIRGDGGAADLNGKEIPATELGAAAMEDGKGWIVEYRWDIDGFADKIGFDIIINDSDDPTIHNRHAQYFWNSYKDDTYNDERQWGILHLARK